MFALGGLLGVKDPESPLILKIKANCISYEDALIVVRDRADEVKRGYKITWEPPILRHFQVSLAPIEG